MGIGFLLLDYNEPKSATEVLDKSHFIQGRRLYVRRREYKEPSKLVASNVTKFS